MIVPNMPTPVAKPARLAALTVRILNSSTGTIGCSTRCSHHRNTASSTTPAPISPSTCAEPQGASWPPRTSPSSARREAGGQQRGAGVVDLGRALGVRRDLQRGRDDDERDQRDGQRDEEHPAPVGVVGDVAARGRPEDRGDAEHRAGQALPAAAVRRRHEVADRGDRERHQRAGAEPLDPAREDELGHRLRGRADDPAGHEQHDAADEEQPPAVHVGQPAVDRRGDRRGEHVGGEDPRVVLDAAEVGDDHRQRGGHDRLVERGQQHAQQHADDRDQRLAAREQVARRRASQLLLHDRRRGGAAAPRPAPARPAVSWSRTRARPRGDALGGGRDGVAARRR